MKRGTTEPGATPPELYDLVASANAEVATRLTAALDAWRKELIAPVFPGSSVKDEDWGPGGANQRNVPQQKNTKP